MVRAIKSPIHSLLEEIAFLTTHQCFLGNFFQTSISNTEINGPVPLSRALTCGLPPRDLNKVPKAPFTRKSTSQQTHAYVFNCLGCNSRPFASADTDSKEEEEDVFGQGGLRVDASEWYILLLQH